MTRADWCSRSGRSSSWIRRERRLAIYLRDEFTCAYCGRDLHDASPREVALDHLLPRCKGGSNASSNLITACRACNSARQEKPWRQYATGGAIRRIELFRRRALNLALARAIIDGQSNVSEIR